MVALNVGSGQRRFTKPWINIDCVSREGQVPDKLADARHLPYADVSVDMVCLHHVLEHFGCGEANDVVKECWRVLKHEGRLFVFVPDTLEIARRYVLGRITPYIYNVNTWGAYQGEEGDRHRWGFSGPSLMEYLANVAEWAWTGPYDWRGIEGMDAARDWWIAAVEAVK